ncbi:MAG: hypothetical protein DRJ47_01180 [Thermoprotei archaeon]|nr:MAG: hypothetical protein DRJ47_01180 [Thermoprotei archaeon]
MARKIILVTADYDPLRGKVKRLLREIAEEMDIEVEERKEDWELLIKHGEKDELGGFDLPQVFVEMEDGSIKHVLTRIPLNDRGKLDLEKARETIVSAIK